MGSQNSKTNSLRGSSVVNTATSTRGDVTDHPPCRLLQNFILFWLDSNIDESKSDFNKSLGELRHLVSTIRTHTNVQICMQEIQQFNVEKVFLIVSGALGQTVVPEIQKWPQIDSIYIFCKDVKFHGKWAKNFSIVKGVYNDIKSICDALKIDRERCERTMISVTFQGVDPLFLYTQLIKEAVLQIEDDNKTSIKELAKYCRSQQNIPENEIQLLEREYHLHTPIWWYTAPYFLYTMLNRCLRLFDVDIILKMGFFMRQLHHHIQDVSRKQRLAPSSVKTAGKPIFEVFRGQGLSMVNFEKLKQAKGGLMSFNNFLSTSYKREVSLKDFALPSAFVTDCVGILFIMKIDTQLCIESNIPFVEINENLGYFKEKEAELLFSTHTIFKIDDIQRLPNPRTDQLYEVKLTLESPNNYELNDLANKMREELGDRKGLSRLGFLLNKAQQSEQAAKLYKTLLQSPCSTSDLVEYNQQLGITFYNMGDFSKALSTYQDVLEIQKQIRPQDHIDFAKTYRLIGLVYDSMGKFSKALSYHEKSLEIQKKSLPSNHSDLAKSYDSIGSVYSSMGEYSKALLSYQQSLKIDQEILPSNHPALATTYSNIGLVYDSMGNFPEALSSLQQSLDIRTKVLPPNHPDVAASLHNIGLVYSSTREYEEALSMYQQALTIRKQVLPANHPDLAASYSNIGLAYQNMGDYSKALSSYQISLEIDEKTLDYNHPDLGMSYGNIGFLYEKMHDYEQAYEYHERSLEIFEASLPNDHPMIQKAQKAIQKLKQKLEDMSQ